MRGFTQGLQSAAHGQRVQHESAVQVYQGHRHRDLGPTASNLRRALQRRSNSLRAAEGVDEILKRTPGKEAREAKAGDFIDNSLLKESRTERLVQSVGTLNPCASSSQEGRGGWGSIVVRELFTHAHQVAALDSDQTARMSLSDLYVVDLTKVQLVASNISKMPTRWFIWPACVFRTRKPASTRPRRRWEFADIVGDAERFNRNVAMTNNVLAAARVARREESRLRLEPGGLWPLLSVH